jgi:hypothetical protein
MTYTVAIVNHALKSGRWVGSFATLEEAQIYCRERAARSQPFVEFQPCEGSPKHPGRKAGPSFRGTPRE